MTQHLPLISDTFNFGVEVSGQLAASRTVLLQQQIKIVGLVLTVTQITIKFFRLFKTKVKIAVQNLADKGWLASQGFRQRRPLTPAFSITANPIAQIALIVS